MNITPETILLALSYLLTVLVTAFGVIKFFGDARYARKEEVVNIAENRKHSDQFHEELREINATLKKTQEDFRADWKEMNAVLVKIQVELARKVNVGDPPRS